MPRNKMAARSKVLATLARGPHTAQQIAQNGPLSTRTVYKHLQELIEDQKVTRIDLGDSLNSIDSTFPKGTPRVFYQRNLFGPLHGWHKIGLLLRSSGRFRYEPAQRGFSKIGMLMLGFTEDGRYYVKRPWIGEDVKG